MTRLSPPSGAPPPQTATLPGGEAVKLVPLAELVADRYYEVYADEIERYGPVGREWCVHDNLYLLAWAYDAQRGEAPFQAQVLWLARVLHRREFPLDRLAHDLRIAAAVLLDEQAVLAEPVAELMRGGAAAVERYAAELP